MDACSAVPQSAGFVSSMAGFIDCQAQVLGSGAWSALATPGSTLQLVLTGFLTIFIALIGYNLLLGTVFTIRDGTLAALKIGAVFALATSWPAYRTLVYDLVTDGPPQLVSEIGPRAAIIGSDGSLLQRLDYADQGLSQLAILGTGPMNANMSVPPPPFAGFDSFALGGSRILFLLTAVASLGAVRIVTGLMLALGPLFIAFLMFDSTRSLFEGWIRVLAGAALAAFAVPIGLGLELGIIEPWLSNVLARRMAGEPLPTMPAELFVITCLFTIIVIAALVACARVPRAFRLAAPIRLAPTSSIANSPLAALAVARSETTSVTKESERSRAAAMASLLVALERRESGVAMAAAGSSLSDTRRAAPGRDRQDDEPRQPPIGRSFTRRVTTRVSARATRRDSAA